MLADSTWGAGTTRSEAFEPSFRPHYFGVPPRQFALSHWPEDSSWQLLGSGELSYSAWIRQPIVSTCEFFGHALQFLPGPAPPKGTLSGDSFRLVLPEDTFLLFNLGGQRLGFKEQRDKKTKVVTITSPELKAVARETELQVFARRGSPYGNFTLAAKYLVTPSW